MFKVMINSVRLVTGQNRLEGGEKVVENCGHREGVRVVSKSRPRQGENASKEAKTR